MAQRPDRTSQSSFELPDEAVIFRFLDTTHIHIIIPANSQWRFPLHWHTEENSTSCHKVTCLKGKLIVTFAPPPLNFSGSVDLPPGQAYEFKPGYHNTFGSLHKEEESWTSLEAEAQQISLLRNVCGAILDAQLYPSLASTPYWIRLVYWLMRLFPSAQQYLTAKLLWVQIQMMRSAHNYYVDHGKINVPLLWWFAHLPAYDLTPPKWTYEIMYWSLTAISKTVQRTCYWTGRLFMGMKAEYAEYASAPGHRNLPDASIAKADSNVPVEDPGTDTKDRMP